MTDEIDRLIRENQAFLASAEFWRNKYRDCFRDALALGALMAIGIVILAAINIHGACK